MEDINKVRSMNGQEFINDFKRCSTLVEFSWACQYVPVPKIAVWELAKKNKIVYMVIEGDNNMRSRMIIHDTFTRPICKGEGVIPRPEIKNMQP